MTQNFALKCQTAQKCIPQGVPFRDRLTALHDAMLAQIAELEAELTVTDKLLEERNRVMLAIPACETHGGQCVPHALKWIDGMLARIAELEAENKRLRSDITALLTGTFNDADWARHGYKGGVIMTTMKDRAKKILTTISAEQEANKPQLVDGTELTEMLYTLWEGGVMPDGVSVSNEQATLIWSCVEHCRLKP